MGIGRILDEKQSLRNRSAISPFLRSTPTFPSEQWRTLFRSNRLFEAVLQPGIGHARAVRVVAESRRPGGGINWRMLAGEQPVELVETTQIEEFIPVMKEIDFGDRFLLSMLHWCGIGRRSTPLDYWKVLLVVYTGLSDDVAVSFYKSLGFEVLGSAVDWALGRTMDDSDIVLRRML